MTNKDNHRIYIYPDGLRGTYPLKWDENDRQRERREILEAAKKIKAYCEKQTCDFCILDDVMCLKDERIDPRDWAIDDEE